MQDDKQDADNAGGVYEVKPKFQIGDHVAVNGRGVYVIDGIQRGVCPCGCRHVFFVYQVEDELSERTREVYERSLSIVDPPAYGFKPDPDGLPF